MSRLRWMHGFGLALAACATLGSEPASAQTRVLKCVDAQGRVAFVGASVCPDGSTLAETRMVDENQPRTADPPPPKPVRWRTAAEHQADLKRLGISLPPPAAPAPRQAQVAPAYRCKGQDFVWFKVGQECGTIVLNWGTSFKDKSGEWHYTDPVRLSPTDVKPISKSEACRAIMAAGASSRRGAPQGDSSRCACNPNGVDCRSENFSRW